MLSELGVLGLGICRSHVPATANALQLVSATGANRECAWLTTEPATEDEYGIARAELAAWCFEWAIHDCSPLE